MSGSLHIGLTLVPPNRCLYLSAWFRRLYDLRQRYLIENFKAPDRRGSKEISAPAAAPDVVQRLPKPIPPAIAALRSAAHVCGSGMISAISSADPGFEAGDLLAKRLDTIVVRSPIELPSTSFFGFEAPLGQRV
jgi:hypothetical protein